ncbi:MAG: putative toxin-antitoxin system toxin component, PIN family [Armatimonadota bacterium]
MRKPRVLIDTNILLSGLIWSGNESHLLDMSVSGEICLLIPQFVIDEARQVLANKFPIHAHLLDEVLNIIAHEILDRPSAEKIESAQSLLRDPNDAEVMASIIEFNPDFAVTGDKDLLTPEVHAIFPTCRCIEFFHRLTHFYEN